MHHRSVFSMGKLEEIDSKEDKKVLADSIEAILKGERRLFIFEVKPVIEKYAKEFANRIINEKLLDIAPIRQTKDNQIDKPNDYETVNINSLQHEDVRELGAEWLCK